MYIYSYLQFIYRCIKTITICISQGLKDFLGLILSVSEPKKKGDQSFKSISSTAYQ